MRTAPWRTVRGRLLIMAVGVELLMLSILVTNSLRLLHEAMTTQARLQAAQVYPVLEAALTAPMAQRDYATVKAILNESRAHGGMDYLAIVDNSGKRIVSSGWPGDAELPEPNKSQPLLSAGAPPRYDVAVPLTYSGQKLGTLHFGLNLSQIVKARKSLLVQGGSIAVIELLLSSVILLALGYWITRHLKALTDASSQVASGNLTPMLVSEGEDDVGRLGVAFNTMSRTIAARVTELTEAKERAEESEKAKSFSEEQLKLVLDGSMDGFWDWDILTGRVEFSRRWVEMLGYSLDEIKQHVSVWESLVHPEDLPEVMTALNKHLDGHAPFYETEHRLRTKSGEWKWVLDRGKVVRRDGEGRPLRAAGTHTDISDRKQAEKELHRSNQEIAVHLEEMLARNREIAILGDMTAMMQACSSVNEALGVMKTILPQLFAPLSGSLYITIPDCRQLEAAATWGVKTLSLPEFTFDECWGVRRGKPHFDNGSVGSIRCPHLEALTGLFHLCVPMAAQGEVFGLLYLQDTRELTEDRIQLAKTVTESIVLSIANLKLRESLHAQSICDPLTGLYNRRFMEETLRREVIRSARSKRPLAVLMTDIDHFKRFNDAHGHEAGDAVLKEVGKTLKTSCRGGDVVCRYGGEEFVIVLPEASQEDAAQKGDAIRRAIEQMVVRHAGKALETITISVGISTMPNHASGLEELLREADAALYKAKREGRNRVAIAQS